MKWDIIIIIIIIMNSWICHWGITPRVYNLGLARQPKFIYRFSPSAFKNPQLRKSPSPYRVVVQLVRKIYMSTVMCEAKQGIPVSLYHESHVLLTFISIVNKFRLDRKSKVEIVKSDRRRLSVNTSAKK